MRSRNGWWRWTLVWSLDLWMKWRQLRQNAFNDSGQQQPAALFCEWKKAESGGEEEEESLKSRLMGKSIITEKRRPQKYSFKALPDWLDNFSRDFSFSSLLSWSAKSWYWSLVIAEKFEDFLFASLLSWRCSRLIWLDVCYGDQA